MDIESHSDTFDKLKYISMMASVYFACAFGLTKIVESSLPALDEKKPRSLIIVEMLAEIIGVAVGIHFIQTSIIPKVIGNRQIKPSWVIAASAGLALGLRLSELGKKYDYIYASFAKDGLF